MFAPIFNQGKLRVRVGPAPACGGPAPLRTLTVLGPKGSEGAGTDGVRVSTGIPDGASTRTRVYPHPYVPLRVPGVHPYGPFCATTRSFYAGGFVRAVRDHKF